MKKSKSCFDLKSAVQDQSLDGMKTGYGLQEGGGKRVPAIVFLLRVSPQYGAGNEDLCPRKCRIDHDF